ncbi:BgTH12-06579 [Blumeria graminis f. sp. triticale]|nr:BgTH12-06579 [Blumeria graminis f. sp. triticale]
MGLLAIGTPLEWVEAQHKADQVRRWGVEQLLSMWNKAKSRENDALLWGDEVEYLVVDYKDDDPRVTLSLRQAEILEALAAHSDPNGNAHDPTDSASESHERTIAPPIFHPEFGRFMLESTPGKPWGSNLNDLLDVEPSMRLRRKMAKQHLLPHEFPLTLTNFPRLGSPGITTTPYYPVSGERLRSQFVPDEIANPHIRFPTLAANIRARRGRKVQINVPVYRDTQTPWPWKDPTVDYDLHRWPEDDDVRQGAAPVNFIHMDAMAFGMGTCCLQITFQARDLGESRLLYDQLSPLAPIFLALTAATPIYKGFLADTDVRWNQIGASVDDRTREELGEEPLQQNRRRIPKSRYAANSTYIAQDARLRSEYMDPDLPFDPAVQQALLAGGMDVRLATHFAHLFIRDPLVVFAEDLESLNLAAADHFENLQSTNWQHVRFKPPPPASNEMGWRVEFRPMEVQLTDFENAAFTVFIVLLTRAILSFNLNFYLPIARTDENMETAHARNAVTSRQFYFRRNPVSLPDSAAALPLPIESEYRLMSIDEIINGSSKKSPAAFPGLLPLVETYLANRNVDVTTSCQLRAYFNLIRDRANGRLWTAAHWMRSFVQSHAAYTSDSVVSEVITHDLVQAVLALETGPTSAVPNRDRFLPT